MTEDRGSTTTTTTKTASTTTIPTLHHPLSHPPTSSTTNRPLLYPNRYSGNNSNNNHHHHVVYTSSSTVPPTIPTATTAIATSSSSSSSLQPYLESTAMESWKEQHHPSSVLPITTATILPLSSSPPQYPSFPTAGGSTTESYDTHPSPSFLPPMVHPEMPPPLAYRHWNTMANGVVHHQGTTATTTTNTTTAAAPPEDYLYNLIDHSILYDTHHRPITIGRILATKPLKSDLLTRPGPGNKKLVYLSGDTITRSLNEIFSYTGWNLQIVTTEQVLCVDTKAITNHHPPKPATLAPPKQTTTNNNSSSSSSSTPMWHVAYLSHVRITLTQSGSYREDLGAGDAMDKNLGTAIQHAIKASITDAMKRAARHFGDKLGNSLYQGTFRMAAAPNTLAEALEQYDQQHTAKYKNIHTTSSSTTTPSSTTTTLPIAAKVESTTMPIPSESQPNHHQTHHPKSATSARILPMAHPVVENHNPSTTTTKTMTTTSTTGNCEVVTATPIMPPPPSNQPYLHNSYANHGGNARTTNQPSPYAMATAIPVVSTAPKRTTTTIATTSNTHRSMGTPNQPPPLTATEHLQSMLCFEKENDVTATINHQHHHNNTNYHEALVHTNENDPTIPSKPTSVIHHKNHSSTTPVNNTTTNQLRPRTSNGRSSSSNRKSSPKHHPDIIDAVPVVAVVIKKSKLNPYST